MTGTGDLFFLPSEKRRLVKKKRAQRTGNHVGSFGKMSSPRGAPLSKKLVVDLRVSNKLPEEKAPENTSV